MEPRVLAYESVGDGNPVILLPGGLTGWVSWVSHVRYLSGHHRVIRVQPIHNELGSAGVAGDMSYNAHVERESLKLTLDELGIELADFAGWSRGGGALIEFALAYPEVVRSLALVEPAAEWVLEELGETESFDSPQEREFIEGLVGNTVTEEDMGRLLTFAGMASSVDDARAHPQWSTWLSHRAALSWPYESISPQRRSLANLELINCPVLLVKGKTGSPRDMRVVDVLAERLPKVRLVELDGGHASHIESIDRFIQELEVHIH